MMFSSITKHNSISTLLNIGAMLIMSATNVPVVACEKHERVPMWCTRVFFRACIWVPFALVFVSIFTDTETENLSWSNVMPLDLA